MSTQQIQRAMLKQVAEALGTDLRAKMAFVGGCTTALYLSDEFTLEQVRHTDDVDIIVHVMGRADFYTLQDTLRKSGFKISMPDPGETVPPVCAMQLGELRVDFMPDDQDILGFTNRWYQQALSTATHYELEPGLTINLVDPVYFVATKLEAWKGRGNGDALSSHDIEDILNVVDGRPELVAEIAAGPAEVKAYIADEIRTLLEDDHFEYAVASQAGNSEREEILFERLEVLAKG